MLRTNRNPPKSKSTPRMPSGEASETEFAFTFSPDSLLWKVCRERCSLIDGPAAAILQIAHPKVGSGVRDHSDFQISPLGRLQRTLSGVNTIAFGTVAEARASARHIARRHATVRGNVDGADPNENPYTANDPDLLLWVMATLVMASLNGYERAFGRVNDDDREGFYRDMRAFGTWFGLRQDFGPQTWSEHSAYWDAMIADPAIGSHPSSKAVAWGIVRPRAIWLRILTRPLRFSASEILPLAVRDRLGFRSTVWSRFCMRVVRATAPFVVPRLPDIFRYAPEYRRAMRRVHQQQKDT